MESRWSQTGPLLRATMATRRIGTAGRQASPAPRADASMSSLHVLEPHLSSPQDADRRRRRRGRHALPLAERLEWVTAVEPSEGMRALIPPRDNMTVVASTWEDAAVAPADLFICCHVLYGVEEPVPFIAKMERSARERIFVMLREGALGTPAVGHPPPMPGAEEPACRDSATCSCFCSQMGIAPDVDFFRYPSVPALRRPG